MKILHVASFRGNIGDNASHIGFRSWFSKLLNTEITWVEYEIREVYWEKRRFDSEFVFLANDHDLLVIGGGNYFELWVEGSQTGTSINISKEDLDNIKTPIFINGVGVDIGQGIPDGNVEKFEQFLLTLIYKKDSLVSVRNDGAVVNIDKIGLSYLKNKIIPIPDGAFFANFDQHRRDDLGDKRIGVNIAGDMLEQRFPGGKGQLDYKSFLKKLADLIERLLGKYPDLKFHFFPHIFRDLHVYSEILNLLSDETRRTSVVVSRYDVGQRAADEVFAEYLGCELVLGMRFHSNIVPIVHGIPTIGLECYPQIGHLYNEIDLMEYLVDVKNIGFDEKIFELTLDILSNKVSHIAKMELATNRVRNKFKKNSGLIEDWIKKRLPNVSQI